MELDEFIKESLVQLCRGVKSANDAIAGALIEGKQRVFRGDEP